MFVDVGGKSRQRGKDLFADFLAVDDDPVIFFNHDHHFQHIDGVDTELTADQLRIFVKIFRSDIGQVEDVDKLDFEFFYKFIHNNEFRDFGAGFRVDFYNGTGSFSLSRVG